MLTIETRSGHRSGKFAVGRNMLLMCSAVPRISTATELITIGTVDVAFLATNEAFVTNVTNTSTFKRISSAARPSSFSKSPSENRYSYRMLRPSITEDRRAAPSHPVLRLTRDSKTPTSGTGCCARAEIGHAAAPPMIDINSRR